MSLCLTICNGEDAAGDAVFRITDPGDLFHTGLFQFLLVCQTERFPPIFIDIDIFISILAEFGDGRMLMQGVQLALAEEIGGNKRGVPGQHGSTPAKI